MEVHQLKWTTVKLYRHELSKAKQTRAATSIATSLLLCLCDVLEGVQTAREWAAHLRGSGIMMFDTYFTAKEQHHHSILPRLPIIDDGQIHEFLRQIYVSMSTLSMLNGPMADVDIERTVAVSALAGRNNRIDCFLGFSTHLIPIFGRIRRLAQTDGDLAHPGNVTSISSEAILSQGFQLRDQVTLLLTDLKLGSAEFYPDIHNHTDPSAVWEYSLLNKAYHHVALIFIHRHILKETTTSSVIRASVNCIITSLSTLPIRKSPSPAVALAYPLFAAGSAAMESIHREQIRAIFRELYICFGSGNTKSLMESLERQWEAQAWLAVIA